MRGICNFCSEERELINFKKVKICILCKANQFRKPRGKEIKASTAEFTKPMSGRTHSKFAEKSISTFKLGPLG